MQTTDISTPHLHLVSFNVPYPDDYGGVIDVMSKLRVLHSIGVKVHLHCYTYGRRPSSELEQYCEEVCYYKRDTSPRYLFVHHPYIVASRCSKDLLDRLLLDRYPILLEGLHCCWLLETLRANSPQRIIWVRAHNVEHDYYRGLAQAESNPVKRLYFNSESHKLASYEPVLRQASGILAISQSDYDYFVSKNYCPVFLLEACHSYSAWSPQAGRGDYWLYHGNLSVSENEKAVLWLLEHVASRVAWPLVVAGKDPSASLCKAISRFSHVTLYRNPDEALMSQLVANSQVVTMVTDQPTGMKLKLLRSLGMGRHCLVNSLMVQGTGLESLCHVHDNADQIVNALNRLMLTDFTPADIERRLTVLNQHNSYTKVSDWLAMCLNQ